MSEETNQAGGAAVAERPAAADKLREVPADITEYTKFVADGGLEHNAKIIGREAAEKSARDAGLALQGDEDGAHKPGYFERRIKRLNSESAEKIRERDSRIADLEARLNAAGRADKDAGGASRAGDPDPDPDKDPDEGAPPAPKPAAAAAPAPTLVPRPKEADFKTYSEFVEALTDWKTERKFEAIEQKRAADAQEAEAKQRYAAISAAHDARVEEAAKRYEDWGTVFDGLNDESYTRAMRDYIIEADNGPDITYWLATNRKELARIRQLHPLKQAAELGRIEDRLRAAAGGDSDDADPEPKRARAAAAKEAAAAKDDEAGEPAGEPAQRRSAQSRAPAPAKPLGGRGGSDDAMPDPSDFQAYEKWAKRQQAKAKL